MEFEVKKNSKKKIIIIIISIIALICFITAGLIYYFNDKSGKLGSETQVGDINAEVIESKDEGRNLQNETKAINTLYKDAVAWIKIPGTSLDTVVFQADNNDRYLRHDRDNKNTKWGETFLDYRSDIKNMDNMSHFIVYGHNTETDDHFTPTLNYKNKEFFNTHQIIEMSTLNGNYRWQIFSVYVTDIDFYYIDTTFADINEYKEFVNGLKSKSMYNTNQSISEDDTILTLSTCDYTRKNGRFVIQAKLIK